MGKRHATGRRRRRGRLAGWLLVAGLLAWPVCGLGAGGAAGNVGAAGKQAEFARLLRLGHHYQGQISLLRREQLYLVMGRAVCALTPETVVRNPQGRTVSLEALRFPLTAEVVYLATREARPLCLQVTVP